jgi:hypothetical protein
MTEAAAQARVRAAFRAQVAHCTNLGSPFTARLSELFAERLTADGVVGRRALGWTGDPSPKVDGLPLRLAGGLHALVRSGEAAELAAVYPPHTAGDDALWAAVVRTLDEHAAFLDRWLEHPPQTNEVARSSALMGGLLVLAARFGLPFAIYELGASAGLNLNLDRFRHDLGGVVAGDTASAVRLAPAWEGPPPPDAPVEIVRRRGVDVAPLDAGDPAARARLLAFVWADQTERVARLEAALAVAAEHPPEIDAADAADWIEPRLAVEAETGVCRVVQHTIAWQYFPEATKARIRARLDEAGARASADAPLAWLRLESEAVGARLRLTVWPGGEDTVLAEPDAHVRGVRWLLKSPPARDR